MTPHDTATCAARASLIPGTSSPAHLEENVAATAIALDADDLATLDAV